MNGRESGQECRLGLARLGVHPSRLGGQIPANGLSIKCWPPGKLAAGAVEHLPADQDASDGRMSCRLGPITLEPANRKPQSCATCSYLSPSQACTRLRSAGNRRLCVRASGPTDKQTINQLLELLFVLPDPRSPHIWLADISPADFQINKARRKAGDLFIYLMFAALLQVGPA